MFSQAFFHGLVITGLVWTALGAIVLVALLVRDWITGRLW